MQESNIKKIAEHPEYKQVLVDRTIARRLKMRETQPAKANGRPRKEEVVVEKEPSGRPRKYI